MNKRSSRRNLSCCEEFPHVAEVLTAPRFFRGKNVREEPDNQP